MIKRTLATASVLALAGGLLAGCGSSGPSAADGCKPAHQVKTLSSGQLTVTAYDLPPFSTVQGNDLGGVDGDILKAIAAKECWQLKVTSAAPAAIIPAVQSGRADVAAGDWYRTAERARVVDLSDPIYTDQMAIISSDGTSAIPDLKSKTVGTVDGYLWVSDLKKYLGGSLRIYNSPLNMYQDLSAGRIGVAVDSYGSGVYNTKGKDFQVKVAQPLAAVAASTEGAQSSFPVPKGHQDLLTALNDDIASLRKSGQLAKIMADNGLDKSAAEPGDPRLIGG